MLAVMIGNIAPPKKPWKPLNKTMEKQFVDKAQPIQADTKPLILIRNNTLVDNNFAK